MADFSAVIRRAIGGLSVNTPEERGRIYERARATIQRQLDSVPEGMNRGIFEAQLLKIENSILAIEQEYADAGPDILEQQDPPKPSNEPVQQPADINVTSPPQEVVLEKPPQSPPITVPEVVEQPVEPPVENLSQTVVEEPPLMRGDVTATSEPEPIEEAYIAEAPAVPPPLSNEAEPEGEGSLENTEGSVPSISENLESAEKAINSELEIPNAPIIEKNEPYVPLERQDVIAEQPTYEEVVHAPISEPIKAPLKDFSTADNDADLIDQAVSEIQSTLQEDTSNKSTLSDPNLSFGFGEEALPEAPAPKRRKSPVVIIIAVLLLIFVALAFLFWRVGWQGVQDLFPQNTMESSEVSTDQGVAEQEAQPAPVVQADQTPADGVAVANEESEKFTQRLNSDGTEIDEGPASDLIDGLPNEEGRSVASADASDDANANDPIANQVDAGAPALQRMFFYETSLGLEQQARYEGSIVWSEKTESDSQISRPYIEGTIQVPERDLSIVMTIKLNGDETLPVSHLIDLNFSLPAEFDGGEIEQITEVKLKNSEEQTGDRLQAISAKIGPSFFVVGLQNDEFDIVESNLQLMGQRGWIDIPISYTNGRKALITLEKGASGNAIFDKVLASWRQNPVQ